MASRLPAPPTKFGYYDGLSPERQRFVDEYLLDLNAAAAARRAGYTIKGGMGWKLLNDPTIQKAINEQRDLVANERGIHGSQYVLGKLWDVVTADPRELVAIHRVPCRYCWGTGGGYQFTNVEMERLLKAYQFGTAKRPFTALWPTGAAERAAYMAGASKLPFDQQGGEGYTTRRDPNSECSECGGLGIALHYVADTRKLSEGARQLYRGIKVGKDKIEVLMADQDAAVTALAKHYGVATERREVWLRSIDPSKLSDDDLLRAVAELQAIDLERSDFQTIATGTPTTEDTNMPVEIARQHRRDAMARARAARRPYTEPKRAVLSKRRREK